MILQPHLFLIHGQFGYASDWLQVIEHLPLSCRITALVLPGHELSFAEAGTFSDCMQRLSRSIRRQTEVHEAPFICGYSLGGRHALTTASYVENLSGLVLIASHPGLNSEEERREKRADDEKTYNWARRQPWLSFVDYWLSQPLFNSLSKNSEQLTLLRCNRLHWGPRDTINALKMYSLGNQPLASETLAKLKSPLLYISGEQDVKYTQLGEALKRQLPEAELAVVPGAGHNLLLETPRQVASLIASFISKLSNDR